ncbi:MAG TPA: SpoIID/LytB domain-containing protein [Actinomycetes bacterium]|nr:SpoIID/LytB domain-containing protein [Actinomycetes bacterium]
MAVALSTVALPSALPGFSDGFPGIDGVGPAVARAGHSAEKYRLPGSGRFQLSGLGFGHGIGMSQFGAEGMGELGKSYEQIVKFYYPGTSFAKARAGRQIRVLLSGVVRSDFGHSAVLVRPKPGLRVVNAGRRIELPSRVAGHRVTGYRVQRTPSAMQVRAYNGSTSRRVAAGLTGTVRFATASAPIKSRITLVAAAGNERRYRGFLDVRKSDSGLMAMSNVRLEDYLRSVVSTEVPSSWTNAALRAQAVAARSYAMLAQLSSRKAGRAYDICDTTTCQVYGPIRAESKRESDAVHATSRRYLRSGGKPALTMFSSANGGYTVAGSRKYLVAKKDPYDGVVTGAANWGHSWQTTVSGSTLANAWPQVGRVKALKVCQRDGNGRWGGRVLRVAIIGSHGTARVSADSFRWGLGLKSAWWTVTN